MKRKIIAIDEEKCTGCGQCIPHCPEGALRIVDGKARMVGELLCDGLGACIGHCPEGAITVEEREAEPYDERKVIANIVKQGPETLKAHLEHLKKHNQTDYLEQALEYLNKNDINIPKGYDEPAPQKTVKACPGSKIFSFSKKNPVSDATKNETSSQLTHWPIQMHLISPLAHHYHHSDLLLAADCAGFSLPDFHPAHLKNRTLTVACPKLDQGKEIYIEKLKSLIDDAEINSLTVIIMEVPCCGGLLHIAGQAAKQAKRKIPIHTVTVSLQGDIIDSEILSVD